MYLKFLYELDQSKSFQGGARVCVVDSSVVVDWLRALGNTAQIRLCCLICTIKTITDHFWIGKMNMPYPNYLVPLFQNDRNLSYENNFDLHEMICTIMRNTFYFEWFRTKTRCDMEAQGNWEMAY